ncbi:hypothetical protein Syn8016DRAFT_1137 [Synechococcus sp. WH 8016]|nr:hypothetical protein Syn8016DRAFT_1137 [Synechococcus sp. WH 8016]
MVLLGFGCTLKDGLSASAIDLFASIYFPRILTSTLEWAANSIWIFNTILFDKHPC